MKAIPYGLKSSITTESKQTDYSDSDFDISQYMYKYS
jgi:hypothetical protein